MLSVNLALVVHSAERVFNTALCFSGVQVFDAKDRLQTTHMYHFMASWNEVPREGPSSPNPQYKRVPGTRPNISESYSEISTRVPFSIAERVACTSTSISTLESTRPNIRESHVAR